LFAIVASQASAQSPPFVPLVSVERPDVKALPLPMPTGEALTADDLDAWLDGYMPYALKIGDIAGAVVVVVKDGQVLTQRGYGYADVAKRIPVNPARTLFRPGSVSKLFTWTAVMQQVEQGKLDLDADVNRYLDFRIPDYDGKPITLRNIMTHTTGFDETGKGIIFEDSSRLIPLGDYVKGALPKRIYAPGSTPSYSNYATALAGYIVERVSGQSFDAYVEQRIFAPLGMKSHMKWRRHNHEPRRLRRGLRIRRRIDAAGPRLGDAVPVHDYASFAFGTCKPIECIERTWCTIAHTERLIGYSLQCLYSFKQGTEQRAGSSTG